MSRGDEKDLADFFVRHPLVDPTDLQARPRRLYIPAQLELPFDRLWPAVPSMWGASRPLSLQATLAGQIRDLGLRHNL